MEAAGSEGSRIKRTRRSTAKSRHGCSRCKTRRIKCDERRPACRNCVRFGCECPGFEQQLRWSKKHERLQTLSLVESQPDVPLLGSQVVEDSAANQATDLSSALAGDNDPAWQDLIPPAHQATDLFPPAQLSDGPIWNSTMPCEGSGVSESQHDIHAMSNPGILQTLVHLPTTLIEYWFRCICPMRSTFDSNINYNRQLARTTWTTSEAVFYTMQAMSAACLLDSMPQLIETLPSLRAQATAAIDQGISHVRMSQLPSVTADLVFAVFALGTSLHWTTPALPEHPWLESARELLLTWGVQLSAADALIHAYFCQALTYWEMLLAAVGRGSIPVKVETKRQRYQGRLRRAMNLPGDDCDLALYEPPPCDPVQNLLGTRPNSWCGVSNEVIDVFGQALALCRSARLYSNRHRGELTVETTSRALGDMSYARELQRELLAMDFGTLVLMEEIQGFPVQTGDDKTPVSHLLQTAEAYRQAALLQLHLAFGDLESEGGHILNNTGGQSRAEFLLSLTLKLVATLEQIPAESGSRSIHPMLYLSAAAGLKFDVSTERQDNEPGAAVDLSNTSSTLDLFEAAQPALHPLETSEPVGAFIPQSAWEVSRARCLVWTRLSSLQQTLPHRAAANTLQLVKAIWLEYDGLRPGRSGVHWLDVLRETGSGMMLW